MTLTFVTFAAFAVYDLRRHLGRVARFVVLLSFLRFAFFTDVAVAGDPGRGARDFQACMVCHSVKPGEHSTGPSLANIWKRKAGSAQGFSRYSAELKAANVEWNENSLDKWLSAPQDFIPGTSMKIRGIPDARERADLIAYLKAVSENRAPDFSPPDGMKGKRPAGG